MNNVPNGIVVETVRVMRNPLVLLGTTVVKKEKKTITGATTVKPTSVGCGTAWNGLKIL